MDWRKFTADTETSNPQFSSEDHVGDFLRLERNRAQRIVPEGQPVNSEFYTEDRWTDF